MSARGVPMVQPRGIPGPGVGLLYPLPSIAATLKTSGKSAIGTERPAHPSVPPASAPTVVLAQMRGLRSWGDCTSVSRPRIKFVALCVGLDTDAKAPHRYRRPSGIGGRSFRCYIFEAQT